MNDWAEESGQGAICILCNFCHETLCNSITMINNNIFAISSLATFKSDIGTPTRSWKINCE